jgi:hypothetical protein
LVPELEDVLAEPDEPVDAPVPAPPEEPDGVEAAAGGGAVATGAAAGWAWKPSTAAVPATVAEMMMGARLMLDAPQNVNDSKWIRAAATPVCSRVSTSDAVNASGPQT